MPTTVLDGLVERYGLETPGAVGEFVAGAVLKHSRDLNLARETALGSKLEAHPGVRHPAGLRHRPPGRRAARA